MSMPHMYPTSKPRALDMESGAVEAPMPDLVTEPTEFPCGALFIAMVSIVRTALATVVSGKPHFWVCSGLLGATHSHFIQGWPF